MEYLYKLVDLINEFEDGNDNAEKQIRDLVCYISDNDEYMKNELYRSVIFEASEKLRMFGYIKGKNKISAFEFSEDDLYDIKHETIQNYYRSRVFSNNLLDKRQKQVVDRFMILENKRMLVSAPTSFGKTFLLREIIYLNRDRYKNILLVFPTIALLNENTESINNLIQTFRLDYKVINNVYSGVSSDNKYIFILTPERTLKLLADNGNLIIDFFFFDEVYKIDEDFDENEDSVKNIEEIIETKEDKGGRAKAFRIALYLLAKQVKEYYLAGPYLNLDNVKSGMKKFILLNNITTFQVEFEPTVRIEIDAWKMNSVLFHPVLGESKIQLYDHASPTTKEKVSGIAKYLYENKLGQAIFYCSTPNRSMQYTKVIVDSINCKESRIPQAFINHLKRKYNVKYGSNKNSVTYWSLIKALENGIGIHHGKFPKYIQNEILKMFNNEDFNFLFCTSTIIEGVNTNAKNVVVINNSVGNTPMTAFALKNIKGRAGRYYHHSIGRVFYADPKQRNIEKTDEMQLNFQTFDDINILKTDIDNSKIEDLSEKNKKIKSEREDNFDKQILPNAIFIKNRLYPRDQQERYLKYIMISSNFDKFNGLINNSHNINYFLTKKLMKPLLETFVETGILEINKGTVYNAVLATYSINGTMGVLEYHIKQLEKDEINSSEEKIDVAYVNTFDQIRTIIEYEVPKLLCLFESLYQQAGIIKGYKMDEFNLSGIIRFYELGITTELGLFLVEYGFPIDTIRQLERKFSAILNMSAKEAVFYLEKNRKLLLGLMDEYEMGLYERAIIALEKRK